MIEVVVPQVFKLDERQARKIVKEWVDRWLAHAEKDTRSGVANVSAAARALKLVIEQFERANSGDNGK